LTKDISGDRHYSFLPSPLLSPFQPQAADKEIAEVRIIRNVNKKKEEIKSGNWLQNWLKN
jgi:hypothetical protein